MLVTLLSVCSEKRMSVLWESYLKQEIKCCRKSSLAVREDHDTADGHHPFLLEWHQYHK